MCLAALKLISMSGMPALNCQICHFPDSFARVVVIVVIVCQHCSVSYKCRSFVCFTQNLSVEMAGTVKETYYVLTLEAQSNESLAKGMGQSK